MSVGPELACLAEAQTLHPRAHAPILPVVLLRGVLPAVAAVEMLLMPRTPLNLSAVDCDAPGGLSRGDASSSRADCVLAPRQLINLALGPLCLLVLASGGTSKISLLLSGVVALMIGCFGTTLIGSGLPGGIAAGLIPNIPDGASELALAVMGTTAIPVNLLCARRPALDPAPRRHT